MSIKQRKKRKAWLSNIYSICTIITLFFIMAQVFFARRTMIQSGEWEKAKVTIDNIERFKDRLKETALYDKANALKFADDLWPDFTKPEGWNATDTLRKIYMTFFYNEFTLNADIQKSISILDAFAYPIIMGYASEMSSFQSVHLEFNTYTNFIMPYAFKGYPKLGLHVKLLHRLWRVRKELTMIKSRVEYGENLFIEEIATFKNSFLCFDGSEITPASLKQYEKKLEKELKKIQKEIEEFRESSMQ